ncbi:hypothetical protein J6590_026230 [Homalodisca vitripennis]|nr:hypothetical protein J6590_026230 [Homalodisca vitripennis]
MEVPSPIITKPFTKVGGTKTRSLERRTRIVKSPKSRPIDEGNPGSRSRQSHLILHGVSRLPRPRRGRVYCTRPSQFTRVGRPRHLEVDDSRSGCEYLSGV